MAEPSPPANGVSADEAAIQPISRTDVALLTDQGPPKQSQQRPKSAHCDFRESRRWARSNAEWIDNDRTNTQHTSNRRRASEDLLRSQPLSVPPTVSDNKPPPSHHSTASDAESLTQTRNLNCLSRSLSTGNWLNLRGNTTHRKLQVHHQLVGFVRKLTDTSNWATKEPTASLNEPEEPQDSESLTQAASNPKQSKVQTRRIAKLNKKPGMDNIRAQKEATDTTQGRRKEMNTDAVINLNMAEDSAKWSERTLALRQQDIEETKRRSEDLREVLSGYHSDRHGNLLPEINTDTIGDCTAAAPRQSNRPVMLSPPAVVPADHPDRAARPRHSSEHGGGLEPAESTAWKTSNPSSGKPAPNTPMLPPQPGPRISSRHGSAIFSTVRCVDGSPLAGRLGPSSMQRSPSDESTASVGTFVVPTEAGAANGQKADAHLQRYSSVGPLSAFGLAPTKSTDTLTAITVEALESNRPLAPSSLPQTGPATPQPSLRPTKLHSGYVSSGKAPGDAPNRPLPDLPEVPSPGSLEKLRLDAGSRASSRSRQSVHRSSTQQGHNRRKSSLNSISSLNGILQPTNSAQSSPQRRSRSVGKPSSARSLSQKRSSDLSNLANATGSEYASGETSSEMKDPGLGQSHDSAAMESCHDARDATSRDQRIHDKRLQDIASARARRGKRKTRREHQSIQEDPAAEDFPPPPSSRSPSRATIDRQRLDSISRTATANIGTTYLANGAGSGRSEIETTSLHPYTPSPISSAQASHIGKAASQGRGANPGAVLGPTHVTLPMSNVIASPKKDLAPASKHSHVSLRSGTTVAHSHTFHGTQTPPLSESSTPSSDEDGSGVVGGARAHKAKLQKRLHLSASDLAAMVGDMHNMKEQLDAQSRQIYVQSKQLRVIEMQKSRMVEAVNALVAVVTEPIGGVGESSRKYEGHVVLPHVGSFRQADRDSVASTSYTITSTGSGSSGSGGSDLTFISEPDPLSSGGASPVGQESVEFNMDFDRMQELIRLDRKKGSRRKKSGGAVGYLRIDG